MRSPLPYPSPRLVEAADSLVDTLLVRRLANRVCQAMGQMGSVEVVREALLGVLPDGGQDEEMRALTVSFAGRIIKGHGAEVRVNKR